MFLGVRIASVHAETSLLGAHGPIMALFTPIDDLFTPLSTPTISTMATVVVRA